MEGVTDTHGSECAVSAIQTSEGHEESSSRVILAQGHVQDHITERSEQPAIRDSCQVEPCDPGKNGYSVEQNISSDANLDIMEPRKEGNDRDLILQYHSCRAKSHNPSSSATNIPSPGSLTTKTDGTEIACVSEASESRERRRRTMKKASHTASIFFRRLRQFLILIRRPSSWRQS